MKIIYTNKNEEILVDDDVYEQLNKLTWYKNIRGYAQHDFRRNGKEGRFLMHRIVMKAKKGILIDHVNLNKLDNQKSNLRFCTSSQNSIHMPKSRKTKSGFKGVFYYPWNCKSRPWQVGIGVNRKYKYIGAFATVEEAAEAYNKAAIKYHGEFAYLNKIPLLAEANVKDWVGVVGSNLTT